MGESKNFDASSSWFATGVRAAENDAPAAEKFSRRIQLVEDAISLKGTGAQFRSAPCSARFPTIWKALPTRMPCTIFRPRRRPC